MPYYYYNDTGSFMNLAHNITSLYCSVFTFEVIQKLIVPTLTCQVLTQFKCLNDLYLIGEQ